MREQEHMSQDELKKLRRFSYIKMVAMMGIIAAVIAFSSIAWFTMNREVEGEGVQMTASDLPFELQADNTETDYDYYLEQQSADVSTNITSGTVSTIKWFMDDATATSENKGLHPGSHGTLSFRVYPKQSEDMFLKFTIQTSAYKYVLNEQGEILKDDNDKERIEPLASSHVATNYIKGHLLFFEELDDAGYYTKRINSYYLYDTSEHTALTDANDKEYYPVTIHWIWVNTFGQMVLNRGDSDLRDTALFNSAQATYTPYGSQTAVTPRQEIIEFIKSDSGAYFFDTLNTSSATLDAMLATPQSIKSNIIPLSNGYNNADQVIGENVNFILCELSASSES